jgi:hypothetical protein
VLNLVSLTKRITWRMYETRMLRRILDAKRRGRFEKTAKLGVS